MAALALDLHDEVVGRRHDRTGPAGDEADGDVGTDVERERSVDAVGHALVDHEAGPAVALLTGLEDEAHAPGQLVTVLGQDARRTHEHGDMGVVPTCVRTALHGRREGLTRLLDHRERVGVGAEEDGGPGMRSDEVGHDRREPLTGVDVEPEAGDGVEDAALGVGVVEAQLGMAVDLAA